MISRWTDRRTRLLLVAALFAGGASSVTARPAEATSPCVAVGSSVTCTWSTVGTDTFTVPAGVTQASFDVFGAQGGAGDSAGGLGGEVAGTLSLTPGAVLQINVGGQGAPNGTGGGGGANGGFNGGGQGGDGGYRSGAGGGGASDVRSDAFALGDRLFVGGGGGGGAGAGIGATGGAGGVGGGDTGVAGSDGPAGISTAATGGGGGTATEGGTGGLTAGCTSACQPAFNGTAGVAGTGGSGPGAYNSGNGGGGGGGGGLFGGGGGGCGNGAGADGVGGAGGGGGSGLVAAAATGGSSTAGVRAGDGLVTITYTLPAKADQTITFPGIRQRSLGSGPFYVHPTASSGLFVRVRSRTPAVCTVRRHEITLVARGTCRLVASQPGDANYNPAPPVRRSFIIN